MPTNKLIIVALAMVALFGASVSALAVMSIDLGSEWMKVGIVSPGVPMEIVLNKESKRKTPTILSFRDGVRSFGEDAQTIGIRFPKNSYAYLLDLLGKNINNPMVKLFKQRFPYYDIVEDPVRGTVLFQHDEDTLYSPEELIAQMLSKAKEMAEVSAGQKIKDCVLTIPGFFNQAERKSILQAAQLADLKILQLYNDYMAVALNYGIFRRKDFNETAQYVMFYDMGASKTTATVVSYQMVKTKERGFLETNPQATVIGVGYDRTLGGLEVQLRLRDYLAKKFNELKVTSNDVFKNPRAMAKLFKEAGRVKNVLSANTDHYAQIEGLLDDKDFRVQVTRENLEELCKDLFDRVGEPVKQALDMAGLPIDVINQVVLVGAGTRVPKVQEELQKIVNMELSKNINADEAATMGAVYKAADLSAGFQVKKFITKDGVLFPIQVVFERTSDNGGSKLVKRTLFGLMNPYPQKKIITFNKHTNDFSFTVNYAELDHLPQSEIAVLGSLNLTEVNLSGVSDILEKKKSENVDSKGIKAHFFLDDSGVLNLVNAEFVFEKTVQPGELEEEGTFSKLGSTISKLFSGGGDDAVAKEKPVHEEPEPTTTESPKENATDTKKVNDTVKETNATKKEKKDTSKEVKPKVIVIRETIQTSNKTLTLQLLNEEQLKDSRKKLKNLDTVDKKRAKRESSLNNLESFVIDAQNKLYNDEYVEAGTESEIEKIKTACSEVSDWLYDEGSNADADTYDKKLGELQSLTMDLFNRVFEHRERPEALNVLKDHINKSQAFLASAKNFTKGSENDIFTDVEIENLQKVITETIEWRDSLVEEQNKLKKSEPVKLTVYMIGEKLQLLDREVKYLVNKMKIWRPKVAKEKSAETKTEQKASEEKSESQEKAPETNDEDLSKSSNIPEQSSEDSSETNQGEKPEEEIPEPTPTVQDSEDDHSEL